MTSIEVPHPPIASRDQWLGERRKFVGRERELPRHYDRVNADRRRLPMVKVEKSYLFEAPGGELSLKELFEGRRQLMIYHFMFDTSWEKGCTGCTGYANALGNLDILANLDATSPFTWGAPLIKLEAWREGPVWNIPWYSSFGID